MRKPYKIPIVLVKSLLEDEVVLLKLSDRACHMKDGRTNLNQNFNPIFKNNNLRGYVHLYCEIFKGKELKLKFMKF